MARTEPSFDIILLFFCVSAYLLLPQNLHSQEIGLYRREHREEEWRSNGACSCGTPGRPRRLHQTNRTSRSAASD